MIVVLNVVVVIIVDVVIGVISMIARVVGGVDRAKNVDITFAARGLFVI